MKYALAFFLFAHGFAHLVGFLVSWKLKEMPEMPYKTTLFFGRLDAGETGIKVVGAMWLIAALAFAVSSVGALMQTQWLAAYTLAVSVFSAVLCIINLPDSKIGIPVNLAIIAIFIWGGRAGWFIK